MLCLPKDIAEKFKDAFARGELDMKKLAKTRFGRMKAFEKLTDTKTAEFVNKKFEKALYSDNENSLADFVKFVTRTKKPKDPTLARLKSSIRDILDEAQTTGRYELSQDNYRELAAAELGIGMSKEELRKVIELTKRFEDSFNATKGGEIRWRDPNELDPLYKQVDDLHKQIAELKKTQSPEELEQHKLVKRLARIEGEIAVLEDPLKQFVEYWKANNDLHTYLQSLDPAPLPAIWVSQIRRGAMLMSLKSPLKNVISNSIQGAFIQTVKRIESIPSLWKGVSAEDWFRGIQSSKADEITASYRKTARQIYKDTGIDITRALDLNENPSVMRELQDAVHAEGPGAQRKLARGVGEVSFKYLMGLPDVEFSAWQTVSTARLQATKIVRDMGLTGAAAESKFISVLEDGLQIMPKTPEGQAVRMATIRDATTATWTNNSSLSKFSLATRKYLNDITGELRYGDWLIAFAKTPANVISAQLDIAGAGWARGLYDIVQMAKATDEGVKGALGRSATRHFVTSGLGMAGAAAIYATLQPDDYIGDYESYTPTERRLIEAKGGVYNSIRFDIPGLGKRYVSLDYLGGFGASIAGMMAAKQQDEWWNKLTAYTSTASGVFLNLPGISEIYGVAKDVVDYFKGSPDQKTDILTGAATDVVGSVTSVIPAVINDLDKALFPAKKQPDYASYWEIMANRLPFVRQILPKDTNIFGDTIVQRGFVGQMLFGGGASIANDSEAVNELDRLWKTDNLPAVSDVAFSSSRFKELKTQIGAQKFGEAMIEFGKLYGTNVQKEIKKTSYKKLDDEDKKKAIDKERSDAMEKVLKKYKYKKPKKK